jgi:hypothetical protein
MIDPREAEELRRQILGEVDALLREHFAADEWGRALVRVERVGERWVVAAIDVEEIVGDEHRVDEACGGQAARALLPVIAQATEALAALAAVELEEVEGGTFLRQPGGGMAWLPGLVRTPSARFDGERDDLVAALRAKNEALRARFSAEEIEVDVEAGRLGFRAGGALVAEARATVLGTWSKATRAWAWASSHPTLSEGVRRAAAEVTDAIAERDLWEISTPCFATDEPSAWALAALVCDRAGGDGVHRLLRDDGAVYVLVRDARPVARPL